jgi:S-adenosylhomocysteine hydrolase
MPVDGHSLREAACPVVTSTIAGRIAIREGRGRVARGVPKRVQAASTRSLVNDATPTLHGL